MLRILLIRHGETDWNRDRRIMGREEIPLNETGRRQAHYMKESLGSAPLDAIFTSPVMRAQETAQILAEGRDLEPREDERLVEVDYGEWVGMTFVAVRKLPGYVPYYLRLEESVAPGGESLYQVRDRGMSFLEELNQKNSNQTIAVVSHADWIKCVLMHLLDIPFKNIWKFRIDNASVSLLEMEEKGNRIICINQRGDIERLFITRFSF